MAKRKSPEKGNKIQIHKRLIYFRKLNDFTQEEIAEHLEMTPGNYGKYERNEIDISFSLLEKFAEKCQIPVTTLISETEDKREAIIAEQSRKIIELQEQVIQLLTEKRKK